MIKKVLATICAVGLIFASCFVGHKIDSKAEEYLLPEGSSGNIQVINGTSFVPFFSVVTRGSTSGMRTYNVLIRYTAASGENINASIGGGFAIIYHDSSSNVAIAYSIALYRDKQRYPYYQTGIDMTSLFDWQTATGTNEFPVYGEALFTCTAQRATSSMVQVQLVNAPLTFNFQFTYPSTGAYWISTFASFPYEVGTSRVTCRSIYFLPSSAASGGIYTEQQYINYGNQQYQQGQQAGYDKGYSAGITAGGNNSFLSLITAVVDAPITAFTSLLNFDIFGFNVKNVILSILTAALVIACIRFFSGKFV